MRNLTRSFRRELTNLKTIAQKIASLFRNGEQGVWYDPSDFSTMFQDAAGTTPVTAVGQPVGRILDKSGRGNHATQSTPTSRPILQQDGTGRYFLLFDGIDDALQTASVNFTGTDKITVWAGVRKLSDAANYSAILELSTAPYDNNGTIQLNGRSMFTPAGAYGFASKGTVFSAVAASAYVAPITNVITGIGNISSDSTIMRINGIQVAQSTTDQGTGNYGNYPLYIGRRGGTTFPFNGRLYSLIVRGAQSTATQISNTETYVNSKTGAY